jgi:hypothetical protein
MPSLSDFFKINMAISSLLANYYYCWKSINPEHTPIKKNLVELVFELFTLQKNRFFQSEDFQQLKIKTTSADILTETEFSDCCAWIASQTEETICELIFKISGDVSFYNPKPLKIDELKNPTKSAIIIKLIGSSLFYSYTSEEYKLENAFFKTLKEKQIKLGLTDCYGIL